MAIDSARKAVFDTSELLERIIVHLPLKDIFVIQRVSHQFQNVITTSPDIQTKLFLRLKKQPAETLQMDHRFEHGVPMNPLLAGSKLRSYMSDAFAYRAMQRGGPQYANMDAGAAHPGEYPSFLDMYITDPPCYTAIAGMSAESLLDPEHPEVLEAGSTTLVGVAMENKEGLTLRDIIHAPNDVVLRSRTNGTMNGEDFSLAEMITDCEVILKSKWDPVCALLLCFPKDKKKEAAVFSERKSA